MPTFLWTRGTESEKGQANAQVASPRKRCYHHCCLARAGSWDRSSEPTARRLPGVRGVHGGGGTHVGREPAPAWTGDTAANTVRRNARGPQGAALRLGRDPIRPGSSVSADAQERGSLSAPSRPAAEGRLPDYSPDCLSDVLI